MVQRVFLGWEQPFLNPLVSWLLNQRDALAGMLVLVPTSQSGRVLRESLAEAGEALLAPTVTTPGSLLSTAADPKVAPEWMETVAWTEVMEEITDWEPFRALFPDVEQDSTSWLASIAEELVSLRHSLQENGYTLARAASALTHSIDEDRWDALARLETLVERRLGDWQMKSRTCTLAEHFSLPPARHIVLAGITEMPPLLERALTQWAGQVTVLIGAPETESEHFTALGKPWHEFPQPTGTPEEKGRHEYWQHLTLPWPIEPQGSVTIASDTQQQAVEALHAVSHYGQPSSSVVLGSADEAVASAMEKEFTQAGWTAFDPAAEIISAGLARWFGLWRKWMAEPKLSTLADLLTLPETSPLIGGNRVNKAKRLAELRDRWMLITSTDLRRRIETTHFRTDWEKDEAIKLHQSITQLEEWAQSMREGNFRYALTRLLEKLALSNDAAAETAAAMQTWLEDAAPLIDQLRRPADYWLHLMLASIPTRSASPPDGRVIDILGWLELFYESGKHLVICGMNEGKVPGRSTVDPWLNDHLRTRLGLTTDAQRAARDAYLFHAMVHARKQDGRCDLICGKVGKDGTTLLPSRLLLAAPANELPQRIKTLFREIEPPDARMPWHADWKWQARDQTPPERLNVTSLRDYLACPFRYYLKHVISMKSPEPDRQEWNARDFGNVAHHILEQWGKCGANDYSKTEALQKWFEDSLNKTVEEWFGKSPPLTVRIQKEALAKRLQWLAKVQAAERAAGWRVSEIETSVEIHAPNAGLIIAKIDRVDINERDGRIRVIDYKTGKTDNVESAHRKIISDPQKLPLHIPWDSPVIHEGEAKGNSVHYQWTNLQLPLYASSIFEKKKILATPCYFTIGTKETDVKIHEWQNFDSETLESAEECAQWIANRIVEKHFWPPAPFVKYDDYGFLAYGRPLEETVLPPITGKENA